MSRRSTLGVVLAIALALVFAMPALAGGVVISLDDVPPDAQAGVPFTIGFTVFSAHDGSPQSGLEPIVTATDPASGEKMTIMAEPEGAAGHYVATLALPAEGDWQWEIQPWGKYAEDYPASVMTSIKVRAAVAQPAAPAAPEVQVSPTAALWPALAAIVAVAAVASIVLVRARRRAAVRS